MADEKMSKAVAMLCEKYEQLGTLPKRSDFTPSEVCSGGFSKGEKP